MYTDLKYPDGTVITVSADPNYEGIATYQISKPVKMIVVDKGFKKMWFAKPKNLDVDTPHIVEINGTLAVHEDFR